jgi:acyl-homoserine lactone acylase PvdQ
MTKASTFEEWSAALGRQTMPLLNAVYADHQGTTAATLTNPC